MTFKDYFAVVDTRSRCYFSFEDEEDQYFEHGYITTAEVIERYIWARSKAHSY